MTSFFGHPHWLLLSLACIPAALLFFFRFRKLEKALLPFFSGGETGSASRLSRLITVRFCCFALSWIFLCAAASSPRWGTELTATRQEGASVIFVMDVSRSMGVSDIAPSRLAFASRYAFLLTERMKNTPCGVVLVKGKAVLALPLTSDHRSVLDLLSFLSPSMLSSPGSGIGEGVRVALASFPRNSTAARSIVLLTDGEETSSSLSDAAREVRADGAALLIVGVGTLAGAGIDIYPGQDEELIQQTMLREEPLKKAALEAGRGSLYVAGTDTGSAQRILDAALPLARASQKLVYSPKPVYRYFEFLLAAVISFCAGCLAGGLAWRKK